MVIQYRSTLKKAKPMNFLLNNCSILLNLITDAIKSSGSLLNFINIAISHQFRIAFLIKFIFYSLLNVAFKNFIHEKYIVAVPACFCDYAMAIVF